MGAAEREQDHGADGRGQAPESPRRVRGACTKREGKVGGEERPEAPLPDFLLELP